MVKGIGALRTLSIEEIPSDCSEPVDPKALEQARAIVDSIRKGGEEALKATATKFKDIKEGEAYTCTPAELKAAFDGLPKDQQGVLTRVAERISKFAAAQRGSIKDATTDIPGGQAGQTVSPVETAGCYAPGGRYPLPSSVLMTACTARAAGVKKVWVASPHPDQVTMAAAYVAKADGMLRVGGAQAVATLSQGIGPVPKCDIIVGPGNQWVTAAKSLVSQTGTAIDMLAGPSEVLVIGDDTADPATVGADLLAQAEHDVEARPILVSTSKQLIEAVNSELVKQLAAMPSPNRETATEACKKGFAVVASSVDDAIAVSDRIAPEHLEIMTKHAMEVGMKCKHYGGLFVGRYAAEVLGDYGVGPNHVLPTAGTARYTGGLSVHTFLRIRTWMRIDRQEDSQAVVQDSVALARLEGLEGHARAAEKRLC
uniref:Histidinol dehydrogenase n=1 Tax=Hemiselmis andersenii TaxID=464988 RepID=A0A6T8G2Z7_HEMAN